jgi:hypothetical protein
MYTALTRSVVFSIFCFFFCCVFSFYFFFSHSCSLVFSLSSYSFWLLRNLFNKNLMCSDSFWTDSILLLDVYCSNSLTPCTNIGNMDTYLNFALGVVIRLWDRTLWIASCISTRLGIRLHTIFDMLLNS